MTQIFFILMMMVLTSGIQFVAVVILVLFQYSTSFQKVFLCGRFQRNEFFANRHKFIKFHYSRFHSLKSSVEEVNNQVQYNGVQLLKEEIQRLVAESNTTLYIPSQQNSLTSDTTTGSSESELVNIDQAFSRIVNEMVTKGEQTINTEAILERLISQQNENGTISLPVPGSDQSREPTREEEIINDPEYGPIYKTILENFQKPLSAMKDFFQMNNNLLSNNLQTWRQSVSDGMEYFKQNELLQAKDSFNIANSLRVNQTMQQRGMLLYCLGEFEEAAEQFMRDIQHLEKPKFYKACELRLWASACYNHLGDREKAVKVLDVDNLQGYDIVEQTALLNMTMRFYADRIPLEEMMEFLSESMNPEDSDDDEDDEIDLANNRKDKSEEELEEDRLLEDAIDDDFMNQIREKFRDIEGNYFYGNFYMALFYDSMKDEELMKAFLDYPANCYRYPPSDMWYHLPRVLYKQRLGKEPNKEEEEIS